MNMNSEAGTPRSYGSVSVLTVAGLGMFISALDSAVINVALPTIQREMQSSSTAATWMVIAYVIAIAASIILLGRVADQQGRVRVAAWGYITFSLSSILCALSVNSTMMITGRVVQGVGAAMLQATGPSLITTLLEPSQRGKAMGYMGMLIGLGPIIGPAVGGLLLYYVGWQWIFLINLPVCLIGYLGCRRLRFTDKQNSSNRCYDFVGSLLMVLSISGILFAISNYENGTMGTSHMASAIIVVASNISLALFVWWEKRVVDPILNINWFSSPVFSINLIATFLFGAVSAILFIVPPFLFERLMRMDVREIGFMALFAPIGLVFSSLWSSRNLSRKKPINAMIVGFSIMSSAFLLLYAFSHQLTVWMSALLFLIFGIGGGVFQPANIVAVMSAVDQKFQSTIGAAQRLIQNTGVSFGAAMGVLLVSSGAVHFQYAWLMAAGLSLTAFVGLVAIRKQ